MTTKIRPLDLSPAEKLQLVEDLWDDLAATPDAIPIHDWQKAEIARRKANLINNPASGMDWEEAKRRIRHVLPRESGGWWQSLSDAPVVAYRGIA